MEANGVSEWNPNRMLEDRKLHGDGTHKDMCLLQGVEVRWKHN